MSADSTSAPALHEGDWLDVMDGDGIWNVAQVLRLPTPETVEVTYDCWGDEYNEELRRDSERIAPFHTHTRAVKCWAKLDTWPWWPALLTVRAPGSALGSQNLRLEERLLVDFLDKAEFTERSRCWVEKSKVVAFQSDEETRKKLSKSKKKKNRRGETRLKNLEFSTNLLAKCDAREDFPEFVEGTLPVQFAKNFTRPTEEVRKEMGEEIWMRGFTDNRINHAATHGYMSGGRNSDTEHGTELSKSTEGKETPKTATCDDSQSQMENSSSDDTGMEDKARAPKEPKSAPKEPESAPKEPESSKSNAAQPEIPTQKPKNARKRARSNNYDETSDSTDTSRAGKSKSPRVQTKDSNLDQLQVANSIAEKTIEEKEAGNVSKPIVTTKEVRVSPRKYGKTPKVLKTPRRSAANLLPHTPPYGRVLLQVKPRNEQQPHGASHTSRATHARPRAKNGAADKEFPTGQRVQQTIAAVRRSASSDSKSDDKPASLMQSLARMTKATLRADEKLQNMETALEGKLTELAEKSAKAEELRSRCAALLSVPRSETQKSGSEDAERVRSPGSVSVSATRRSSKRGGRTNACPDASRVPRVPTLARRSSQAKCGVRGLELTLDDIISKELNLSLSAATTPAELDAIKADLLNSPKVQAAITRIQHPSYGWTGTSSLSENNKNRRAWEEAKPRFTKYTSAAVSSKRKPSPRSPSQQFGRSWGYGHDASVERMQGPSSLLLDSPPVDSGSFGFSVDDNFSMNQWYRELYPTAFGFQR